MDPFPDEGEVMDPGVSPQDLSGRTSQQDLNRSNNGAISKHKDKDKHRGKDKDKDKDRTLLMFIFRETSNTVHKMYFVKYQF